MLNGLLEEEKLTEEEKDAPSDKMDEPECHFIGSDNQNSMGHLCEGTDRHFRKHVCLPCFHPLDQMNLSKKFRHSVRIDDDNEMAAMQETANRHTRATMQEGSSRRLPSATTQNAATEQKMVITEEPKAGALSDREKVRPDEYNADHLYQWQRRSSLNTIQEVIEPEPSDEQKSLDEFYKFSNQAAKAETEGSMEDKVSSPPYQNWYRSYDGEQDSGLDTEESKTDQNSDSETKLDMIKTLHEENCDVGEESPYEHFDLKRKSQMPINELEEPKMKKVRFDVPKETKEIKALKPKQVKRKLVFTNPILDPFSKKPKAADLSPDKKSQRDGKKTDKKKTTEEGKDEKKDKQPSKKDEEPQDDMDKKPGTSKNPRSGA